MAAPAGSGVGHGLRLRGADILAQVLVDAGDHRLHLPGAGQGEDDDIAGEYCKIEMKSEATHFEIMVRGDLDKVAQMERQAAS